MKCLNLGTTGVQVSAFCLGTKKAGSPWLSLYKKAGCAKLQLEIQR
jgi:hypothetical protein